MRTNLNLTIPVWRPQIEGVRESNSIDRVSLKRENSFYSSQEICAKPKNLKILD